MIINNKHLKHDKEFKKVCKGDQVELQLNFYL